MVTKRRFVAPKFGPPRCVPAFTIQALQENTVVFPPPKLKIYQPCCCRMSLFRKYFLRGDLPIGRAYEKGNRGFVTWRIPPSKLDYAYYLPLFFDGLCESKFPYRELAFHGLMDLLRTGNEDQIACVVPQLIVPIKKALNTKHPHTIMITLQAIQQLVCSGPCVGQALVPYFRQILPIFNLFRHKNVCLGDYIDYKEQIGDLIDATLQILEFYGGPDAYINIKYMVPTYESCVMN